MSSVPAAGPQWCLACHDSKNSWYRGTYPSLASPTTDASGYPLAGTWPGENAYLAESNPHSRIPETTQTPAGGDAIRRSQGDCLYCHAAHRSSNAYDALRDTYRPSTASTLASDQAAGSYAAACFSCHGPSKPSGVPTQTADIRQFVTVETSSAGHRIQTAGGVLPVGAPLPCYECHNPHGSTRGNAMLIADTRGASLETSTAAGVRAFCFTCHTTADSARGWDSDTSAYTDVPASAKVVGLTRTAAALALPARVGHNESDATSCYTCHGEDYGSGGSNVHNPRASVDESAPVTTSDVKPYYSEPATITLTAKDNPGGWGVDATHYILDKGAEATGTTLAVSAEGTHTLEFWSVDIGGNVETPHNTVEFTIDTIAPTTTSDVRALYSSAATITLTATDTASGSGVASTHYVLDGGTETTGTALTVSGSGTHTLEFWSVDAAGNVETPHAVVTFLVDDVAPATSSDVATSYANSATISLTATDNAGGSGVSATYYSIDGGAETTGTTVYVTQAGSHTLEFWSVDVAGNAESPRNSVTFVVDDLVAPTTSSDAVGSYSNEATITLTARDNDGGSGVANTFYVLDGGSETTGSAVGVSSAGEHTLEFWSVDAAGNAEARNAVTFTIADTIAPTTRANVEPAYSNVATITLTATDNTGGTGVSGTFYRLDGSAETSGTEVSVTGAGSHTIEFWSVDAANNAENHTTVGFTIGDSIAPTTTSDALPNYWDSATIALSASDNSGGTGVASTRYVLDGGPETIGTSVTVSTAGGHTLEFWSVDAAGNAETPHNTVTFAIDDGIAPITASDVQLAYVNVATISFVASDNSGGSGVATTRYVLDGGQEATGTAVTVYAAGNHTLEFWSVDNAGNAETPHQTAAFSIADSIAPTTVSDALPNYADTADIALSATDNLGGVGVASTHYRIDGGAETTGTDHRGHLGRKPYHRVLVRRRGRQRGGAQFDHVHDRRHDSPHNDLGRSVRLRELGHDQLQRHRQLGRVRSGDYSVRGRRCGRDNRHLGDGFLGGHAHGGVLVRRCGRQRGEPAQERHLHGDRCDRSDDHL